MRIEDFFSEYDGLDNPDRKSAYSPHAPVHLVTEAFRRWADKLRPLVDANPHRLSDLLFREAQHQLSPLQRLLPRRISDIAYFLPMTLFFEKMELRYAGLFYSALLVPGRTLVIPNQTPIVDYWGYRQRAGKLILDADSGDHIGDHASGGMLINNGFIHRDCAAGATGGYFVNNSFVHAFGWSAKESILINNGDADLMACHAEKSICINDGTCGSGAFRCKELLFINNGKISDFGAHASKSILITTTKWHGPFLKEADGIGFTRLDAKTRELLSTMDMGNSEPCDLIEIVRQNMMYLTPAIPYHEQGILGRSWQSMKGLFIEYYRWYYGRHSSPSRPARFK
ncbi:hypothetical protein HY639_05275 [Candidatus Woesearchaeota archaeon]|nr:hypothetical protein [Candidatus Woesearchaeota archaeon]